MIKVVIADDHEIYRDGLELLLSRLAGVQLLGQAVNGQDLINLVSTLQPNIVLTDIRMPIKDGVEATRHIVLHHTNTGVIALTMYEDADQIVEMLEAGAMGYLVKNATKEEVEAAIITVHKQQHYYCSHTTTKVSALIGKSNFNPYRKHERIIFKETELEVIRLICEGLTSKDIALKINLSYRTIEGYRTRILNKMSVTNTAGIIIYAVKNNLINL